MAPPALANAKVLPAWRLVGEAPVTPLGIEPTLAALESGADRCAETESTLFVMQAGQPTRSIKPRDLPLEPTSLGDGGRPRRTVALHTIAAPRGAWTSWVVWPCRGEPIRIERSELEASVGKDDRYLLAVTGRGELKLLDRRNPTDWRSTPKGIAAIVID